MRRVMLVLIFALGCAASPAAAQLTLSTDPPQQQPKPQPQSKAQSRPQRNAQGQAPPIAQDQAGVKIKLETPASAAVASGRYRFHDVGEGFLRFDNRSGKVTYCNPHTVGWICQDVPENRTALEQEIARLHDQLAALKKQIATLRARPPAPTTAPPQSTHPPPAASNGSDVSFKLSTRADVVLARAYLADTWHRLMEMLANFKKDMTHRG